MCVHAFNLLIIMSVGCCCRWILLWVDLFPFTAPLCFFDLCQLYIVLGLCLSHRFIVCMRDQKYMSIGNLLSVDVFKEDLIGTGSLWIKCNIACARDCVWLNVSLIG